MEKLFREEKRTHRRHNEYGLEVLDETPMQPPLGYKRAPTLAEQIRQQVVAAKLAELDALEETDEEADDFEVGDDFEPISPHENDGAPSIKELKARAAEINEKIKKKHLENLRAQLEKEMEAKRGEAPPVHLKDPVPPQS